MMPSFLRPLHEGNDCHNPAGPGGGQFCSDAGAVPVSCGPAGQCFANVNRWNARHGEKTDRVVHGQVTNVEGKRFAHAWVERADGTVVDPTAGVTMPKARFYDVMQASAEASYTSTDAVRHQIRAMHHGPWTPADLAPRSRTIADTLPGIRARSKAEVKTMVTSYGLTLKTATRDTDGSWIVTVEGDRSDIEHLSRDTEG